MRLPIVMYAIAAFAPGVAACDEFRCGHWLVNSETSLTALLAKCGEPTSRTVSTQNVLNAAGAPVGLTTREVLRYDRGPRANAMIVIVVDGAIERIESEK